MNGPIEILRKVTESFEKINISYFLVGSLASMFYSRPRFTNDIDLVVQIAASQISQFANEFSTEEYYCPPLEVLRDEVIRKGSFNLIHIESGIKVDVILNTMNEYHVSEFSRRSKVQIVPNLWIYIAAAENVILKKWNFTAKGCQKNICKIFKRFWPRQL